MDSAAKAASAFWEKACKKKKPAKKKACKKEKACKKTKFEKHKKADIRSGDVSAIIFSRRAVSGGTKARSKVGNQMREVQRHRKNTT